GAGLPVLLFHRAPERAVRLHLGAQRLPGRPRPGDERAALRADGLSAADAPPDSTRPGCRHARPAVTRPARFWHWLWDSRPRVHAVAAALFRAARDGSRSDGDRHEGVDRGVVDV